MGRGVPAACEAWHPALCAQAMALKDSAAMRNEVEDMKAAVTRARKQYDEAQDEASREAIRLRVSPMVARPTCTLSPMP